MYLIDIWTERCGSEALLIRGSKKAMGQSLTGNRKAVGQSLASNRKPLGRTLTKSRKSCSRIRIGGVPRVLAGRVSRSCELIILHFEVIH